MKALRDNAVQFGIEGLTASTKAAGISGKGKQMKDAFRTSGSSPEIKMNQETVGALTGKYFHSGETDKITCERIDAYQNYGPSKAASTAGVRS